MKDSGGATGSGLALRFYGHGTDDIDRVKIRIDAPAVPADVGVDFTIEFWMRASAGENGGFANCNAGNGNGWITTNIIIDRDIFGNGDFGDYGIGLGNGRIAFGIDRLGSGETICSTTNVADNAWHHIAVTRQSSTGQIRIFVDGILEVTGTGPTGDVSYRNGRNTIYPNSDPYLVLGAEKHDAGSSFPSYSGYFDELRISNIRRYTANFTRPSAPFATDGNTVALYHFDSGPAGACTGTVADSSGAAGGPSNGTCNYGDSGSPPAGPVYVNNTPFP
jgi:hypothetical protein